MYTLIYVTKHSDNLLSNRIAQFSTSEDLTSLYNELRENENVIGYVDQIGVLNIPLSAQNIFLGNWYKDFANEILCNMDADIAISDWRFYVEKSKL
jgi:hypothetical protein